MYLLLDEIERIGKVYNLGRDTEIARCRKISVNLLTNNLEKLKNIYGDEFYSIINSIDTQILLGTNIKADIEYFSDLLGLDDEFIKNDMENDKLLIYERGLKAIMAEKQWYFEMEEWKESL